MIRSRMLAGGEVAGRLEAAWCAATGMRAAAATSSGLAALRLALLALGVGPGDEVLVPAYSCVALLNAPLALGATPVLADVLHDDWTIDPDDVAWRTSARTRAIVAVDLFGMPARLAALGASDLPVVEDCAHGIGGRSDSGPFGGGTEVAISSFYATKLLGAGEGGIVAARDPELIERARAARDYGDRLPAATNLNEKLSDVHAAVALIQLERLDAILAARQTRAASYREALQPLAERELLVLPPEAPGRIWYRFTVRLTRHEARAVCAAARRAGVHLEQPVWDLRGAEQWSSDLPVTATAFERVVSLPLYPDLTEEEQDRVCAALSETLA